MNIIEETETYKVTALGTTKRGRTTYTIQQFNNKATGTTEIQLVGPRGTLYILKETRTPGTYVPVSMMSGQLKSKGQNLFVTVDGTAVQFKN